MVHLIREPRDGPLAALVLNTAAAPTSTTSTACSTSSTPTGGCWA